MRCTFLRATKLIVHLSISKLRGISITFFIAAIVSQLLLSVKWRLLLGSSVVTWRGFSVTWHFLGSHLGVTGQDFVAYWLPSSCLAGRIVRLSSKQLPSNSMANIKWLPSCTRGCQLTANQHKETAEGLPRDCQGTVKRLPRDSQGTPKGMPRDCRGTAKGLPRNRQGTPNDCQGTAEGPPRDCRETAKGTLRNLKASANWQWGFT